MNFLVNYFWPFILSLLLGLLICGIGYWLQLKSYWSMSLLSATIIYALLVALTELGKQTPKPPRQ